MIGLFERLRFLVEGDSFEYSQAYVDNLNKLLPDSEYENMALEEIVTEKLNELKEAKA